MVSSYHPACLTGFLAGALLTVSCDARSGGTCRSMRDPKPRAADAPPRACTGMQALQVHEALRFRLVQARLRDTRSGGPAWNKVLHGAPTLNRGPYRERLRRPHDCGAL